MPLLSSGCTSLPPEPCSGGCGKTAGARLSDGIWTCSDCSPLCGPGILDPFSDEDLFEPVRYVVYDNARRFYISVCADGTSVLLNENLRQMPEDEARRYRHLI